MKLTVPRLTFTKYRPREGHPDWDELQREAGELAADIAIQARLEKRRFNNTLLQSRKRKAIIKTARVYLENRRKASRNDHNFIPLFYIWTMTNQCNYDCSYCSDHRGSTYPALFKKGLRSDLTTGEGLRLIEVMKESSAIYFCGGEPTLRQDLPELLEHSTSLNMFNMINTNGSLIGDLLLKPAYRNFLRQMDVIIVSLDALDIKQLAGIYRVNEGLARKTLRNLMALRILQSLIPFKLVANTVICRENLEESFYILDWCNDLGITFSPVSANIDRNPDPDLINNPIYQELTAKILERARQGYPMIATPRALEKLLKTTGFSCYPGVFDHIDYDGGLFWPCKAYPEAVKIKVLDYNNVREIHQSGERAINPTGFHGTGPGQCQGHCAWMQNCVTDMYASALFQGLFASGILKELRGLLKQ